MLHDMIKVAYQTEVIFNLWFSSFGGIFGVLFYFLKDNFYVYQYPYLVK